MAGPAPSQQATIEWRRLAADKNVAIPVARGLWEQAKAAAPNDPVACSAMFRRLLDEAAKGNAAPEPGRETLADAKPGGGDPASLGPGKFTRVLLEQPGAKPEDKQPDDKQQPPAPAAAAAAPPAGGPPGPDAAKEPPTAKPTVEKLRNDLVAAAQASGDAAALLTAADPATIMEVLRQLREGSPGLLQKVIAAVGSAIERRLGQVLPDPAQNKPDGPVGISVPIVGGDGEVQQQTISDTGVPMMGTKPVSEKVTEWRAEILKQDPTVQQKLDPELGRAAGLNTTATDQAKKAKLGDEPAKTALPATQQQLAPALGSISRELAAEAAKPVITPPPPAPPPPPPAIAPPPPPAAAETAAPAPAPLAPAATDVPGSATAPAAAPAPAPAAPAPAPAPASAAQAPAAAVASAGPDKSDPAAEKTSSDAGAVKAADTATTESAPQPAKAPPGIKKLDEAGKLIAQPGVPRDPKGVLPEQGGAQANDARKTNETAAGALARPEIAPGGPEGETVAAAAARLHGEDVKRDSHFNPLAKVKFERDLAKALLARASLYDAQVNRVSSLILKYFDDRLRDGIAKGVQNAQNLFTKDLAVLTSASKPGWWGAVEIAADATKEDLAAQTRTSLTKGTLPQKMAVHQNMAGILVNDFDKGIAQGFMDAAAKEPWYVRQQTKLKDGALDQTGGTTVFADPRLDRKDPNADPVAVKAANDAEAERGRMNRPDMGAVSPAAPGIQARNAEGKDPTSLLPEDSQQVNRGIDAFTMDESKAFCQRARLQFNMPLAAGVSGSTAELINVAMTLGLSSEDLAKYAIAVLAYVGGGGNHSYLEIAVVLASVGIIPNPVDYTGIETLVGATLFKELKDANQEAFAKKDEPPPGAAPPPAVT